MIRRLLEDRLSNWILEELVRSKDRIRRIRELYPSATQKEQAQRLIDEKKKWASTGSAVSGLFGLVTLPVDLAFIAWLQLSLIVDLAVLSERNLKSTRAREELLNIFHAASNASRNASRSSPKALGRLGEKLFTLRGLRVVGKAVPVVTMPLTVAMANRDLQKAGEEAIRVYFEIPRVLRKKRLTRSS